MSDDVVRDALVAGVAATQRVTRTPTGELGYGVDLKCESDLTERFEETEGAYGTLPQDIFHRWTTPKGAVPDDADFGEPVQQMLSAGMTLQQLGSAAGRLQAEAMKDDRVAACDVTLTPSADFKRITLEGRITPEDPTQKTFSLIMSVGDGQVLLEAVEGAT